MPIALIKRLSEEKGIDLPEAEKRWEKAKKIAEEQAGLSDADGEDFWKYVVGVFKKSMGAGEDSISESAGVWDKEKLVAAYPQRVMEARSFSDILAIFSDLFPYAVAGRLWEGEYEAAKRFRALFEEFQREVDIERKWEIANELDSLSQAHRYKSSFESMAGPGLKSGDLVAAFAASTIGSHLLERNCQDGERAAEEVIPGYKEKMNIRSDIQGRIDRLQKEYVFAEADILTKKKDAEETARKACGAFDLQTRVVAMNDEHWKWTENHARNIPPRSDAEAFAKWDREREEYNQEYESQFRALMDQSHELEEIHVKPVRDKYNADLKQASDRKKKEIHILQMAQQEIDDMVGGAVISRIMESSPVTKEEADQWAKGQWVSKSAITRLKKQGYEESALREHMAEFYRLTGGRVGKAFIETTGDKRAKAALWDGTIYIDGRFTKRTLFHEMGHLLEREPKLEAMSEAFRDGRAKKGKGTRSLRSITKNSGYRSDEVAYTDDFFDAYIGKVYRYKATEVLSMGAQMFANPTDAAFLAGRDPQMFNMMLGFMLSKPTDRELAKKEKIQEVATDTMTEKDRLEKFYQTLTKKAKDDSFWEGRGSLISRLEGYGRGKGSGKTMILYYYPGDPQGPGAYAQSNFFKSRQAARNFAYLYLLYVQKGIISDRNEASSLSYDIANSVLRKAIPPKLKIDDLPTFIEDLK